MAGQTTAEDSMAGLKIAQVGWMTEEIALGLMVEEAATVRWMFEGVAVVDLKAEMSVHYQTQPAMIPLQEQHLSATQTASHFALADQMRAAAEILENHPGWLLGFHHPLMQISWQTVHSPLSTQKGKKNNPKEKKLTSNFGHTQQDYHNRTSKTVHLTWLGWLG